MEDKRIDIPTAKKRRKNSSKTTYDPDRVGRSSEWIARFLGTPKFLLYLTVFCILWLVWNTFAPDYLQFDSIEYGFTALTLVLSLQASYAAPLILLAENRQIDRDRVIAEQDRQRNMRNLADTEFLMREIGSIKLALNNVATRDFVRSELHDLVKEDLKEILLEIEQEKNENGKIEVPAKTPDPKIVESVEKNAQLDN